MMMCMKEYLAYFEPSCFAGYSRKTFRRRNWWFKRTVQND